MRGRVGRGRLARAGPEVHWARSALAARRGRGAAVGNSAELRRTDSPQTTQHPLPSHRSHSPRHTQQVFNIHPCLSRPSVTSLPRLRTAVTSLSLVFRFLFVSHLSSNSISCPVVAFTTLLPRAKGRRPVRIQQFYFSNTSIYCHILSSR